jgi:hypothetical protein
MEEPLPNDTTRRLALNIPLIVLWVAAIAIAGLGYWLLQTGNAAQADFYNTQGSDYLQFLNLQTQSTLGGMLLTAGVVGVFIALAIHARNRAAAVLAANATATAFYEDEIDEDDAFDGTYGDADAQTGGVTAPAASRTAADDATSTPVATGAPADTAAAPSEPAAAETADVERAKPATDGDDTSAEPTDGTTRA